MLLVTKGSKTCWSFTVEPINIVFISLSLLGWEGPPWPAYEAKQDAEMAVTWRDQAWCIVGGEQFLENQKVGAGS